MLKVAVLDLGFNENVGREDFDRMSNIELMLLCEDDGMLFTIEAFQRYVNDNLLDVNNSFIRIF